MEKWTDGIYLLRQYNQFKTGLWLLENNGEAAILEMPMYDEPEEKPYKVCQQICKENKINIKYFLCSHAHMDHFSYKTYSEFKNNFPKAKFYLQQRFQKRIANTSRTTFFKNHLKLDIGGEVLYLIHAPKHSWSDTMVVFKGAVFTGDWELNTIRSVHDGKQYSVPYDVRLKSIATMAQFEKKYDYHIHKVFSVHANDKRENVQFTELILDTKNDRELW